GSRATSGSAGARSASRRPATSAWRCRTSRSPCSAPTTRAPTSRRATSPTPTAIVSARRCSSSARAIAGSSPSRPRASRTMRGLVFFLLLAPAVMAAAGELVANRAAAPHAFDHGPEEAALVAALAKVQDSRVDEAIADLEQVVRLNPTFRLAQLVYADLLLAKARPITDFGSMPSAPLQQIMALREEAKARLRHYREPLPPDRIPAALVKLGASQRHAIVVNL